MLPFSMRIGMKGDILMNPMSMAPTLPIRDIPHFFDEIEQLFDEITGPWSPILFKEKFRQPILNCRLT